MDQAADEETGGWANDVSAQPAREGLATVVVGITAQPWKGQARRSPADPCAAVAASKRATDGRPADGLAVEMPPRAPAAGAGAAP